MIEHLTSKNFLEHLQTTFQAVRPGEEALPLELIEVIDFADNPRLEQFSLVFRGPRAPWLQQGTVQLEHSALGSVDLFMTPLGFDEVGMKYQAIINRFRK